jgi:hypothetical protein
MIRIDITIVIILYVIFFVNRKVVQVLYEMIQQIVLCGGFFVLCGRKAAAGAFGG